MPGVRRFRSLRSRTETRKLNKGVGAARLIINERAPRHSKVVSLNINARKLKEKDLGLKD